MNKSTLFIGDMHVQLKNLEDSSRVFNFIYEKASLEKCDSIVFLGDIYHTHAVLRQEVISLVQYNMSNLKKIGKPIYIIVGNHDGVSPSNITPNAIRQTLGHIVNVVDDSNGVVFKNFLLMPFTYEESKFIESVNRGSLKDKILVCHQTFNNAQYENGFYAPHGFHDQSIQQSIIIAGDIHKRQSIGKVTYLGSTYPVSSSDTNTIDNIINNIPHKAIYFINTDATEIQTFSIDFLIKNYFSITINKDNFEHTLDNIKNFSEKSLSNVVINATFEGNVNDFEDFVKKTVVYELSNVILKKSHKNLEMRQETVYNLDDSNSNIESLFKEYIFNSIPHDMEYKEKIWKMVQQLKTIQR